MNMKSKVIAAAAVAFVMIAAPSSIMAQAAPAGNNGGSADNGGDAGGNADAGTYGFGSPYHNVELHATGCDHLRKRAQWSDSYHWWREYNRCVAQ